MQGLKALGCLLSCCTCGGLAELELKKLLQQGWTAAAAVAAAGRAAGRQVALVSWWWCGWCAWAVGAGVGSSGERGQTQQSWRLLAGGLGLGFVLLGLLPLFRDILR